MSVAVTAAAVSAEVAVMAAIAMPGPPLRAPRSSRLAAATGAATTSGLSKDSTAATMGRVPPMVSAMARVATEPGRARTASGIRSVPAAIPAHRPEGGAGKRPFKARPPRRPGRFQRAQG